MTATKVVEDSYVDDSPSGGSPEEVDKMRGEVVKVNGKFTYTDTVTKVLDTVGMHPKVKVMSGIEDEEAIQKLEGRVLGHLWDAKNDKLMIKLMVNLTEKRRGIQVGPDLRVEDLPRLWKESLSKRKLLSMLNAFYDPMGLICAFIIKLKIKMRDLTGYGAKLDNGEMKLGWDDAVPSDMDKSWNEYIELIMKSEAIVCKRGTKPKNALCEGQGHATEGDLSIQVRSLWLSGVGQVDVDRGQGHARKANQDNMHRGF
jgi:hypothetical protein